MDVLTFETCWAVNGEIIKQVTSSWSIFIQISHFMLGTRASCYSVLTKHCGNPFTAWSLKQCHLENNLALFYRVCLSHIFLWHCLNDLLKRLFRPVLHCKLNFKFHSDQIITTIIFRNYGNLLVYKQPVFWFLLIWHSHKYTSPPCKFVRQCSLV